MKRAVRRPGCLAVGMMLASLTAAPLDRLTAQGDGVASLPISTRSAGLAGAGVALLGDAGSAFANPAGIATIRHLALEGSYERYSGGTTLSSAAVAVRVGRWDYGLAAQALRPPPATTASTDVLGLSALVLRLGMIAVGTSLKYVRQGSATPQVEAWVGDAGVAIALFDIFALGASVQNLGGHLVARTYLPRRTRFGFTMNYVDPQGSLRLLTTLEAQWPEGQHSVLVAGAEGGILTRGIVILARVGVSGRSAPSDQSPLSVGAGVALGRLQLDYAFRSHAAPSGAMNRFGVRWAP